MFKLLLFILEIISNLKQLIPQTHQCAQFDIVISACRISPKKDDEKPYNE